MTWYPIRPNPTPAQKAAERAFFRQLDIDDNIIRRNPHMPTLATSVADFLVADYEFPEPAGPTYAIIHSLITHLQDHGIPAQDPYPNVPDPTNIRIYTRRFWSLITRGNSWCGPTTEIILHGTTLRITTWGWMADSTVYHSIDLNDPRSIPELTHYLLSHHKPSSWYQFKQNLKNLLRICSKPSSKASPST